MICDQKTNFHHYTPLFETNEVKAEYCIKCKKRNYWRVGHDGRMDNQGYAEEHKRNFFQPGDKYYEKEYGK